jgi:hypothetical protein
VPVPDPNDDRVHEPRDDPRWRESYYFSFFDPDTAIGGFSSIGKRPSRGHAGFINVIWGPQIPTLAASEFDSFDRHDDTHAVAGMRYRSQQPFGPWQISFEGTLNDGGSSVECDRDALGTTEKSPAPKVDVALELTFTPDRAPYLYHERDEWRDLFDGHIDEVGMIEGELRIGGERHTVRGRGGKDHSWGVRDWFKPREWRWVDVVRADGPEAELWRASFDGDGWVGDGALFSGEGAEALTSYSERVSTADRPGKPLPTGIELDLGSETQRLRLSGEVVRAVPIIFSRESDGTRFASWNDRALVRCETESGSEAWANVEFESLLVEAGGA